jgi:hypothetical protein
VPRDLQHYFRIEAGELAHHRGPDHRPAAVGETAVKGILRDDLGAVATVGF